MVTEELSPSKDCAPGNFRGEAMMPTTGGLAQGWDRDQDFLGGIFSAKKMVGAFFLGNKS